MSFRTEGFRSDATELAWADAVAEMNEAYFVEQAHAEALAEDAERTGGAGFELTRRETNLRFAVTTTGKVTTYRGTDFTPNYCSAKILGGQIVSVTLSKLDEHGYGIDDPAGPDGAELHADFGGGQLNGAIAIMRLPRIAQDALAAIKWAIR